MSEVLAALLRVNLAGAIAVATVLALRLPVRRLFGARVAYGLWILVPLAAAAMLTPARLVTITQALKVTEIVALKAGVAAAAPAVRPFDVAPWLVAIWTAGAVVCGLWLVRRQVQFARASRTGRAGPAVIGVLAPRIVLPADFEARYSLRERQVILAHERTHIVRQDSRINALVAAARCAAWFNPLAHLSAHLLRIDQELACDAEVMAAHPSARRAYAEAMLKTQLATRPLPLGCYWPSPAAHPLAERIGLLARGLPSRRRQNAGAAVVAVLALAGAASAWAARPPQVVVRTAVPSAPLARPVRPAQAPAIAALSAPRPAETPRAETAVASPATIAAAETFPPAAAELPATVSEPARTFNVRGAADRSYVEPDAAVRVLATMTDPDGRRLVTDLTAFGSQALYRTGYVERDGSRFSLFTSVEQRGQTLYVTASLGRRFAPATSGTIPLASGQTGTIVFDDGQTVTVTPTLRRETPVEAAEGRRLSQWLSRERLLVPAAFEPDVFLCGRQGAIC